MSKPDFSTQSSQAFVVFSDDDTFEGLSGGSTVLLVDGEFDCGNDKSIRHLIRDYDERLALAQAAKPTAESLDPMTPIVVSTDDAPSAQVRAISVNFLLSYYLRSRESGGPIGVKAR